MTLYEFTKRVIKQTAEIAYRSGYIQGHQAAKVAAHEGLPIFINEDDQRRIEEGIREICSS